MIDQTREIDFGAWAPGATSVIAEPTLAEVTAQHPADASWQTFTADEIGFMERYTGQPLPIDTTALLAPTDGAVALSAMTPIVTSAWNVLDVAAVELAMQGPLAGYFPGLTYDVVKNDFHPTTDGQLSPMYAAIFQAAPADAAARRRGSRNGSRSSTWC